MAEVKQRTAAKKFVEDWTGKGYEKGESQKFWIQLLREVLGVENPEQFISFEDQVHLDHTSFIDARIPATKVLIEQKSSDKDLYKAIKQSDGSLLNPFQQAKRYITELPLSQHPRWVVTCNKRLKVEGDKVFVCFNGSWSIPKGAVTSASGKLFNVSFNCHQVSNSEIVLRRL